MYILSIVHLVPKILQEKWIRSKRENEMSVCLDLKTDLHSCYGLNCVQPWLPMWWYYEVGPLGGTQVDMGFGWWSFMMGLASPYFSLILPLLVPFNHHMWEDSKKRKTDASQECLHRELSWPQLWCCSLQSMTTGGTKRMVLYLLMPKW